MRATERQAVKKACLCEGGGGNILPSALLKLTVSVNGVGDSSTFLRFVSSGMWRQSVVDVCVTHELVFMCKN